MVLLVDRESMIATFFKSGFLKEAGVIVNAMNRLMIGVLTIALTTSLAFSTGLDLIVIVDQSGSMSGRNANNDPLNIRNKMVERIFDYVKIDADRNKVLHRLGVVSFGTSVRIDLPLTEITQDNEEVLRKNLMLSLSSGSLGFTDFQKAFVESIKMFESRSDPQQRRSAIILITDGAPYAEGININTYKESLRNLIKDRLPSSAFELQVIALNDERSNYWLDYRDYWIDLSSNRARKLDGNRNEIFRALQGLIGNILKSVAVHIDEGSYDNLIVPPYLESIVFDIFVADGEGTRVDFYPADKPGQPLTGDDDNVEFIRGGETIQTLVVKRPSPGRWRIRKSRPDTAVDIYSQRFFPRGELLSPASQGLRQFDRARISYRVVDPDSVPLQVLAGYPLTLGVSVVKPDGDQLELEMSRAHQLGEGVYETLHDFECDLPGRYRTEVQISTKDISNREVTLFRDQWSGFSVDSAHRIDCRIVSPENEQEVPLYGPLVFMPKSLDLELEYIDEQGQPLNLPALFPGPASDSIVITSLVGNRQDPLKVELEHARDGVLKGSIRTPAESVHRLKVRPNKATIPEDYNIRVIPTRLTIYRGLTLSHWLQLLIFGTALATGILIGGRAIWMNVRHPLKGTLYIDRLGGSQIREIRLPSRRYSLKLKELPLETKIKKLIVRARKSGQKGITVTALGGNKSVFLHNRDLSDRGTAMLQKVPYVIRYREK